MFTVKAIIKLDSVNLTFNFIFYENVGEDQDTAGAVLLSVYLF